MTRRVRARGQRVGAIAFAVAVAGAQPTCAPAGDAPREPADPPPAVESPGAAAASRGDGVRGEVAPAGPAFAAADLQGRWLAGGKDRFHLVLDVRSDSVTVTDLAGEVRYEGPYAASRVQSGYWIVGDPEGRLEVHAFVRSRDELAGVLYGENGLATARRVHAVPEDLQADWRVGFSDNYHLAEGLASLGPDTWSVRVGTRDARRGHAFGLGVRDGAHQLALQTSGDYLEVVNFVATPGDTWLGWIAGTDQQMVWHADGARPPWIPPPGRRVAVPGVEGSLVDEGSGTLDLGHTHGGGARGGPRAFQFGQRDRPIRRAVRARAEDAAQGSGGGL